MPEHRELTQDEQFQIKALETKRSNKLSELGFLIRETLFKYLKKEKEGINKEEYTLGVEALHIAENTAKEIAKIGYDIAVLQAGSTFNPETKQQESGPIKHRYHQFYAKNFEAANPIDVATKRQRYTQHIIKAATKGRVAKTGKAGKEGITLTPKAGLKILEDLHTHYTTQQEKKEKKEQQEYDEYCTQTTGFQERKNKQHAGYLQRKQTAQRQRKEFTEVKLSPKECFEKRCNINEADVLSLKEMNKKYNNFIPEYFSDEAHLLVYLNDKQGVLHELKKFSNRIVEQESDESVQHIKHHLLEVVNLENKRCTFDKRDKTPHIFHLGLTKASLTHLAEKHDLSFSHLTYKGKKIGADPVLFSKYFGLNPEITRDRRQCVRYLTARAKNDRPELHEISNTSASDVEDHPTRTESTFIQVQLPTDNKKDGYIQIGNPCVKTRYKQRLIENNIPSKQRTYDRARSSTKTEINKNHELPSKKEFLTMAKEWFPDGTYSAKQYEAFRETLTMKEKHHRKKQFRYLLGIFDIHSGHGTQDMFDAMIQNDREKMQEIKHTRNKKIETESYTPINIKHLLMLTELLQAPHSGIHMTIYDLTLKAKSDLIDGGLANWVSKHGKILEEKYGLCIPASPQTIHRWCLGILPDSFEIEALEIALFKRKKELIDSKYIQEHEIKDILLPGGEAILEERYKGFKLGREKKK